MFTDYNSQQKRIKHAKQKKRIERRSVEVLLKVETNFRFKLENVLILIASLKICKSIFPLYKRENFNEEKVYFWGEMVLNMSASDIYI